MLNRALVAVLLCTFLLFNGAEGFVKYYEKTKVVDETTDRRVVVNWNVVNDELIEFGIWTEAKQSLAIGFADNDLTDLWIVQYNDGNCREGCVQNGYWKNGVVQLDQVDELEQVYTENKCGIAVEFSRKIKVGSSEDVDIVLGSPMMLKWTTEFSDLESIKEFEGGLLEIEEAKHLVSRNTQAVTGTWSSPASDFTVSWTFTTDLQYIDFTMVGQTTGWISVGFGASSTMTSTDMYTGWVSSSNAVSLYDTWSTGRNRPGTDTSQGGSNSILNPTGSQSGTSTTISFRRLVNTGDTRDSVIRNATTNIMYGIARSDGTSATNYPQHSAYAADVINFFGGTTGGAGVVPIGGADPTGPSWSTLSGDFTITWQISGDSILIKMSAKTTGWISLGLSDRSLMSNSDCITGWVTSTGTVVLLDTWSPDYNQPVEDTANGGTNDVTLIAGSQDSTTTSITFQRKLTTGDKNDFAIANGYMFILWGYAKSDGTTSSYPKHSACGSARVNFYTGGSSGALSPGILVVAVVVGIFALYVIRRFCLKCYKKSQRRSLKSKNPEAYYLEANAPKESPSELGNLSKGYYRGSELVAAPGNMANDEENEIPPDYASATGQPSAPPLGSSQMKLEPMEVTVPGEKRKGFGNAFSNWFSGVMHHRIPNTNKAVSVLAMALVYIIINIGCLFVGNDWPTSFGSLVAANALLATVPATRNSLLVYLVGIPFDRTIMFHRLLGRFVLLLATIHGIWEVVLLMPISSSSSSGRSLLEEEDGGGGEDGGDGAGALSALGTAANIYGITSWIALVLVFFTSIEAARRKNFGFFFYSHFLFVAFFVLGALHNAKFVPFAIAAACLYGFDRVLRFIWGLVPKKTTVLQVKDPKNNVVQVRFPKNKLPNALGMYRVGQYVFVNFPGLSLLEWHPFSLTSGPDELTSEIHIKGLGDHTSQLVERAKKKDYMWVRVDGPYGNLHFNHRRYPILVLVAGGIGITPIMSILNDIYRTGDMDSSVKLKPHCVESIYLVWSMPSQDQYNWFASNIEEFTSRAGSKGMPAFNPGIFVSKGGQLSPPFFSGRADIPTIFNKVVQDHPQKACSVFVCGPVTLVKSCWDSSAELKRDGNKVHFHREVFDF